MEDELRRFGPKTADHPSITMGMRCEACKQPFKEGDYTTLICLGPGEDEEEREKARMGRPYNAVATEVHWAIKLHQYYWLALDIPMLLLAAYTLHKNMWMEK